jgi:hypothetical protein
MELRPGHTILIAQVVVTRLRERRAIRLRARRAEAVERRLELILRRYLAERGALDLHVDRALGLRSAGAMASLRKRAEIAAEEGFALGDAGVSLVVDQMLQALRGMD